MMDQSARYPVDPGLYYGNIACFPQPNSHPIPNPDPCYYPENHVAPPYMFSSYGSVDLHNANNTDAVAAASSNHYNSYTNPPTRVFPVAPNPVPVDHLQFPNNHGPFKYQGHDIPPVMEGESHRRPWNMSGATGVHPFLAHNNSRLFRGSYSGQTLQSAGNAWMQDQFCSNSADPAWYLASTSPYPQGCNSSEPASMALQGYRATSMNGNAHTFAQPSVIPQMHHNLPLPPPPLPTHSFRGYRLDFHSNRIPLNNSSYNGMNSFQDGTEIGSMFVGPAPPNGLQVYHPHTRDLIAASIARDHCLFDLSVLPEDVAFLDEYSEDYYSVDHYGDLRLNIDNMSYEELLALGDHIGSAGSGLSEVFISHQLQVRTFDFSTSSSVMQDGVCNEQLNFCVICQTNFIHEEKIGILNCCHEYHVGCIKQWLVLKNSCPICKSSAFPTEDMECP